MKSFVVDTNAFLRLLLNDIPQQARQVEHLIRQAKKEEVKIIVPQIVIFEIEFVLRGYYNFEKQEIIEKLKVLLSSSYFAIESLSVFQEAINLYEENNISLTDCFLIAKAEAEKADLFTFDQKLKKLQ